LWASLRSRLHSSCFVKRRFRKFPNPRDVLSWSSGGILERFEFLWEPRNRKSGEFLGILRIPTKVQKFGYGFSTGTAMSAVGGPVTGSRCREIREATTDSGLDLMRMAECGRHYGHCPQQNHQPAINLMKQQAPEPNKITGANSRPASPLDAGLEFERASCDPSSRTAAVAQFCR
jgi:hypothetical protein